MRKIVRIVLLFLSLALCTPAVAGAATYYLDGRDSSVTSCSNPDTDYNPATRTCGSGDQKVYKDLQTLLNSPTDPLGSDDIIEVREGTFYKTWAIWTWADSGTSGHPITVRRYSGDSGAAIFSGGWHICSSEGEDCESSAIESTWTSEGCTGCYKYNEQIDDAHHAGFLRQIVVDNEFRKITLHNGAPGSLSEGAFGYDYTNDYLYYNPSYDADPDTSGEIIEAQVSNENYHNEHTVLLIAGASYLTFENIIFQDGGSNPTTLVAAPGPGGLGNSFATISINPALEYTAFADLDNGDTITGASSGDTAPMSVEFNNVNSTGVYFLTFRANDELDDGILSNSENYQDAEQISDEDTPPNTATVKGTVYRPYGVKFSNCDIRYGNMTGVWITGGTITIENSRIHDFDQGLLISNYADVTLENNEIYNISARAWSNTSQTDTEGIGINYGATGSLINNVIHNIGPDPHTSGNMANSTGVYLWSAGAWTVARNHIYDCGIMGIFLTDGGAGWNDNTLIYNNLIHDIGPSSITKTIGHRTGLYLYTQHGEGFDGVKVFNNTIYDVDCTDTSYTCSALRLSISTALSTVGPQDAVVTVQNNIAVGSGTSAGGNHSLALLCYDPIAHNVECGGFSGLVSDNNLFYHTESGENIINYKQGGVDNTYTVSTFGDYQAAHDGSPYPEENQNSLASDPLFVDADGDNFRLLYNSPAFDAGTDPGISGWLDRDGRPVLYKYPIGAYEYYWLVIR